MSISGEYMSSFSSVTALAESISLGGICCGFGVSSTYAGYFCINSVQGLKKYRIFSTAYAWVFPIEPNPIRPIFISSFSILLYILNQTFITKPDKR